jgi:hypothetical protein
LNNESPSLQVYFHQRCSISKFLENSKFGLSSFSVIDAAVAHGPQRITILEHRDGANWMCDLIRKRIIRRVRRKAGQDIQG